MDDDDFSSGSSDSSIDPSQLVVDWKPSSLEKSIGAADDDVKQSESEHVAPAEKGAAPDESAAKAQHDEVDAAASPKETDAATRPETNNPSGIASSKKMKIVIGESVLKWQLARRNQTSLAASAHNGISEYVTIRQDHAKPSVPLQDAKIKLTPPTAEITSGDKEYTGKYESLLTSSNPLVECVAVYNEERKCHVLEVVDWSLSNLKPSSELDTVIPTSHPREQQRQAEERVRKKRKHKATSSRSSKTPKEKKQRKEKSTKDNKSSKPKEKLPKIKYRGVTAVKRKNDIGYRSQITIDGKPKYLGTFSTPEEAAKRYDQEARTKTKNARLNFPEDETFKETENAGTSS